MSGGRLDYLYHKVEEAAEQIVSYGLDQKKPLWQAFGKHVKLVAAALHDCEWVMSNDYGRDDADKAIEDALGEGHRELQMEVLLKAFQGLAENVAKLSKAHESHKR
jgi:hypothetical protein